MNLHSPTPERCHPLVHATWPWPADRSKGLQPRLIGNLWHPLHLPIETNLSVLGDNLSMIQYLIVKWKFSSKKKVRNKYWKKLYFLLLKGNQWTLHLVHVQLQPGSVWVLPTSLSEMEMALKHLQGLDFSNTQILCLVKQTSSWKTPDKSAWKDVYSQISQPQNL